MFVSATMPEGLVFQVIFVVLRLVAREVKRIIKILKTSTDN